MRYAKLPISYDAINTNEFINTDDSQSRPLAIFARQQLLFKYSRVNQKLLYYHPNNCWSLKQKQDDEDCIRIRTIDQRIISNEDRPTKRNRSPLLQGINVFPEDCHLLQFYIFTYIQLKQEQEDDEERQQDASS